MRQDSMKPTVNLLNATDALTGCLNLLEVVNAVVRRGDLLPRPRHALERVRPVRGLRVVVHVVAAPAQRAVRRPARRQRQLALLRTYPK